MSGAAVFSALSREAQRAVRGLAAADALQVPIPTPAITAWQKNGCRIPGALWHAAMWEAAAVDATTLEGRTRALEYSRAIIAVAKGETAPTARAA